MRFGLPVDSTSHVTIEDPTELRKLKKGESGFSRGPKAGHKYWKRVRKMVKGKLKWDYYYNTPEDKRRWSERAAKKIHAERKALTAEAQKHGDHHDRRDFLKHHPHLAERMTALENLSAEYLTEMLGWEKPPHIKISPASARLFADLVANPPKTAYEDEVGGEQMGAVHPLRSTETAFKLLPDHIHNLLDGDLNEFNLTFGTEDRKFRKSPDTHGFC